mgnify:CR=1 FL=1
MLKEGDVATGLRIPDTYRVFFGGSGSGDAFIENVLETSAQLSTQTTYVNLLGMRLRTVQDWTEVDDKIVTQPIVALLQILNPNTVFSNLQVGETITLPTGSLVSTAHNRTFPRWYRRHWHGGHFYGHNLGNYYYDYDDLWKYINAHNYN